MATKTKSSKSLKRSDKIKEAQRRISGVDEDIKLLKMLVYARNGKGKTFFGASGATKESPTLIVDCNEQGSPSIRKVKYVKKFEVNEWTDIDLIYWYLAAGNHPFKTVVIDTTTALENLCMKFILGDEASRDPTKDPQMASKREYGKRKELMQTVILQFRNLPMNVIFLAQERRTFVDEDAEDEPPEIGPALGGQARGTLMDCVNIIGRMYTKSIVVKEKKKVKGKMKTVSVQKPQFRMLLANDHELYISKVNIQDHGLPRVMKDPSIPKIMERVNRKEQ